MAYQECQPQESLPPSRRNSSTSATLSQACNYLQPLQLFRFASLTNLERKQHKDLQQIGLAYFIYLFLYSGMEFTLTFLTHIRFDFTPMQQVSFQMSSLIFLTDQLQGRMFLFVGIVMAVLQGGFVRRIPQGKEKKAAMG